MEILVKRGYVVRDRDSRKLTPTQMGQDFYFALHDMDIVEAETTARWESALKGVEDGIFPPDMVRAKVREYVRTMTAEILAGKDFDRLRQNTVRKVFHCRRCGAEVKITPKGVCCQSCKEFNMPSKIARKELTRHMMEDLLERGRTDKLSGFKRKDGTEFNAVISVDDTGALSFLSERSVRAEQTGLYCPKCGEPLSDNGKGCSCGKCNLTFWRSAFGADLEDSELASLLQNGRVVPKKPFVSRKTGKQYTATLVLDKEFRYAVEFDETPAEPDAIVICRFCGHVMKWTPYTLECDCGLSLWRTVSGRKMKTEELMELAEKGRTGTLNGFVSKKGKVFAARLAVGEDKKIVFDFD